MPGYPNTADGGASPHRIDVPGMENRREPGSGKPTQAQTIGQLGDSREGVDAPTAYAVTIHKGNCGDWLTSYDM